MALKHDRPVLGFQITSFTGHYQGHLLPGIQDRVIEHDLHLIVFSGSPILTPAHFNYQHGAVYDLIDTKNIDVLILSSGTLSCFGDEDPAHFHTRFKNIPMVSLSIKIPGIPSIVVDNRKGIRDAVNHLIHTHNCSRIIFIKGPPDNQETMDRFEAFKETLESHAVPFDPRLVVEGNFIEASGYHAIHKLLEKKDIQFDGIVSTNDDMAVGAMKALKEHGIQIPGDVAVVGFDNIDEGKFSRPPLTTIEQPIYELGQKAVDMALAIIRGENVPETVVLPTRLVVRDSCGCLSNTVTMVETVGTCPGTSATGKLHQKSDYDQESVKQLIIQGMTELYFIEPSSPLIRKIRAMITLFFHPVLDKEIAAGIIKQVRDMLYNEMIQGKDLSLWNNVFTLLYSHLQHTCESDRERQLMDTLFQQVRVITGEVMQLNQAAAKLDYTNHMTVLGAAIQNLSSSYSIEELCATIVNCLPELDIPNLYLVLYKTPVKNIPEDIWHTPEKSHLVLAYRHHTQIPLDGKLMEFPSKELLPRGMFPEQRFSLVIKPLFFREEQYGFIISDLSAKNSGVYESLTLQIGNNINSALLFSARDKAEKKLVAVNERLIETNEQLKELDNAKTEFFANISHELRTPLTLLLSPLESIVTGNYGTELSYNDRMFSSMIHNAQRLLKLINNLLDFSKIQAGKMRIQKTKNNISNLLSFYISNIASTAESRGLSLNFHDTTSGLVTLVDKDLLEKAMFNLISNALKFTPEGGAITFALSSRDHTFSIEIRDTGVGIPEDKLDKIFERFTQIDSSPSRKYEGTGIGLAFTKEIISLLGGSITVSSVINKGTCFTITLPLESGQYSGTGDKIEKIQAIPSFLLADFYHKPEEKQEEPGPGEKNETLLIVEDNTDMRNFLCRFLGKTFHIHTAKNGKQGLEIAQRETIDLIISDVMMPEMDGYEMTRLIKKDYRLRGIPVILLTAKADVSMKIQGLEQGAADYLSKPFNARELLARIQANLEMKRLRDSIAGQRDMLREMVREQTKTIEAEKNRAVALQKKAERQLESFLLVLASAIESKDEYTGGHVDRVAHYSRDLAKKLDLPPETVMSIYLGAIVHDVGKIGVKDSVLNKPGPLDSEETRHMEMHTTIGKTLLSKIEDIGTAENIAYCHQEKWDGTGYPRGLKGKEIPLAARIVTIADYWDSIITDRPYRKAMDLKNAISLMNDERRKTFDPELFDIFMNNKEKIYLRYIDDEKIKEL